MNKKYLTPILALVVGAVSFGFGTAVNIGLNDMFNTAGKVVEIPWSTGQRDTRASLLAAAGATSFPGLTGSATASQVPPISSLTGSATSSQLPSTGTFTTISVDTLTVNTTATMPANEFPTGTKSVQMGSGYNYTDVIQGTGVRKFTGSGSTSIETTGSNTVTNGTKTVDLIKLSQIIVVAGTNTVFLTGTNTETPLYSVTLPALGSNTVLSLKTIWLGSSTASVGTASQTFKCWLATESNPTGSVSVFSSFSHTPIITSHYVYLEGYVINRATVLKQLVRQWHQNVNATYNLANIPSFLGVNTGTRTILTLTGQIGTTTPNTTSTIYLGGVVVKISED